MSNELVEQKTGELVSAINQQGIGELLKPLIREIHLFDSFVAGEVPKWLVRRPSHFSWLRSLGVVTLPFPSLRSLSLKL